MRKRMLAILFLMETLFYICAAPVSAKFYEETFDVEFDGEKIVVIGTELKSLTEIIDGIQPGDNATITFHLENNSNEAVEWYMSNSSVSFERALNNANGAAYEYELTYSGKEEPLFSSGSVGGDLSEEATEETPVGIETATEDLDEFFLLDTFAAGQNATVTLKLSLDGETQTNSYQAAMSDVTLTFAVEPVVDATPTHVQRIVYVPNTGDNTLLFLYLGLEIGAVVLLILVLLRYRAYRRKQKEAR
ncbi:MAG: LPXTG cell wall anchor domain-containing protein [Oscillospiraceae bacterium]|nr:LPXTG cell wall anchor domain-containing protein [Oscillospiraceae bacterium]